MLDLRPNCGTGFERRPIRTAMARCEGVWLPYQLASTVRKFPKHYKYHIPGFMVGVKGILLEVR